jgi:retinol dehydrogenase 12
VFDSFKKKDLSLPIIDRYCQSKLANLMYARALAKHYPQFTTVSINPGDIQTSLYSNGSLGLKMNLIVIIFLPLISISVEDGAKNTEWAATSKDVKSGEYYEPVGVAGKASKNSQNDKATQQLWDWTEKELEGHGI